MPWALVGIALGCVVQAAHANIFVEDRREQHDAAQPIFRSVGVLHHAGLGAGGTAFLVSICHIATAYHVAFMAGPNPRTGAATFARPRIGHKAEFLIGSNPRAASSFATRTRARVLAFGRFSTSDFQGMAGDWAILRLDHCLGKKYGHLKVARPDPASPILTGKLMTVGFPKSRAGLPGITVERDCKARDYGPVDGLVGVDCAFESGMSGGPVLERQGDGRWRVVGLVQQSMASVDNVLPAYSMEHRNQMLGVAAFGKALDATLRAESAKVLEARTR